MGDRIKLLEAIEAAYEVALHPGYLPHALDALGSYLEVGGVHLIALDATGARLAAVAAGEVPQKAKYTPTWCSAELAQALKQMAARQVFSMTSVLRGLKGPSATLSPALPWKDCIAAFLPKGDAHRPLLVIPIADAGGEAVRETIAKLETLLPHLSRAMRLSNQRNEPIATIGAAAHLLQQFPMPCVLTDAVGRCIESNDAFKTVTGPLSIQTVAGRLRFQDSYLQDSWQSALNETAQTAVSRALLAVSAGGKQWKVHVVPIQCYAGDAREPQHLIMAVYEEQGSAPVTDPERFAAVGKLTPAELDVLSGLLQGYTGKVIAKSRQASVNTVRSQIMSILSKTGHRSQKELIAAFGASTFDPSSFEAPS